MQNAHLRSDFRKVLQAVTKNFSTLVFLVAAFMAIILSFIQKIGAIINTIPQGVFGGLSIVLFGLVACSGARIWVDNQIDFKDSRMMLIAGVPSESFTVSQKVNNEIEITFRSYHWCRHAHNIALG